MRSVVALLLAAAAAVAPAAGGAGSGLRVSPWPGFLRTAGHAGVASVAGPQSGRVRWRRRLEGPIAPGAAIGSGEIAYVASNAGILHAIRISDGTELWHFDGRGSYGSDLSTVAAVLDDGIVLWPGSRHRLFALSPRGRPLWSVQLTDDLLSPAVDASRERVYVADQSGVIRGYRLREGQRRPALRWTRTLPGGSLGSPALAPDGTVYETAGGSLYAIAPDGSVRWRYRTGGLVEVSPAVAQDGTIVFGSNDNREYGISPAGHLRWRYAIGVYTYSSPSALPGDRVAFGDHLGHINVVDAGTGSLVARVRGRGMVWTAPAVDAAGDVYFATRRGHVYGFSGTGRRLFDDRFATTFDSYPALAGDGTLLIGADDGQLLAIADR